MPGFSSLADINAAHRNYEQYIAWRKSPVQVTTIGIWFDLSMSPGNPVPQYYAASPLVSVRLARSTDGGLDHGANQTPNHKYLRRFMAMSNSATPLPMPMLLLDYLLYYPFIDEGSTDTQVMTNSTMLSRYTDGAGVQIMPVVVGGHTLAAGVRFNVSYTNSSGVAGCTSRTVELTSAQAVTGTIATSARAVGAAAGPFIPLQVGDTGVRSIESCTFLTADVGLITLVLVKPIAQMMLRGVDAPVEKDFLLDHGQLPRVYDDAYLNLICCPSASVSGVSFFGDMLLTCN